MKIHHILAEIIQGGLVLETNVDEIDLSGLSFFFFSTRKPLGTALLWIGPYLLVSASNVPLLVHRQYKQRLKPEKNHLHLPTHCHSV